MQLLLYVTFSTRKLYVAQLNINNFSVHIQYHIHNNDTKIECIIIGGPEKNMVYFRKKTSYHFVRENILHVSVMRNNSNHVAVLT